METNIKVLGWLYIVMGIIGLLIACTVTALLFGIGAAVGVAESEPVVTSILGIVGVVVLGVFVVLFAPNVVVGIGLLRFKPWARVLGIVLAFLNLLNFPLGTIFGIYALISLFTDDVIEVFEQA